MRLLVGFLFIIASPFSTLEILYKKRSGIDVAFVAGFHRDEAPSSEVWTKENERKGHKTRKLIKSNAEVSRERDVDDSGQSMTFIVLGSRGDHLRRIQSSENNAHHSSTYNHHHKYPSTNRRGSKNSKFAPILPSTIQERQTHHSKSNLIQMRRKESSAKKVLLMNGKHLKENGKRQERTSANSPTKQRTKNQFKNKDKHWTRTVAKKHGSHLSSAYRPTTQRHKIPRIHGHLNIPNNQQIDISSGISESDFEAINRLDDVQNNLEKILNFDDKQTYNENKSSKPRGNIVKAIDNMDDIQGAYDKGLMSDYTFDQVDNADKGTLSDYFHAIDKGEKSPPKRITTLPTKSLLQSYSPDPNGEEEEQEEQEQEGNIDNDSFYDAIDQGKLPAETSAIKERKESSNPVQHKSVNHYTKNINGSSQSHTNITRLPEQNKNKVDDENNNNKNNNNGHEHIQKEENKVNPAESTRTDKMADSNNSSQREEEHSRPQNKFLNSSNVMSVGTPEGDFTRNDSENYHSSAFGEKHLWNGKEEMKVLDHPQTSRRPVVLPTQTNSQFSNLSNYNSNSGIHNISKETSQPNLPNTSVAHWPQMHTLEGPSVLNNSKNNESKPIPQQEDKVLKTNKHPASFHLPEEHLVKGPLIFNNSSLTKGTRITGGKISGGQISGGLIAGGHIKSGFIEGGVISGGRVEGGRIKNGTMDGGIMINGVMEGGHFVDGSIEGGLLKGGNMYGGKIKGGKMEGGNMKGGVVEGGRLSGGNIQGGVLKGGEIKGGTMKGGRIEGGILQGGNIEGGSLKFGKVFGGTLKSGFMLGGQMTNGTIDGGILKGGTVEGGVLKGGVMEGGKLKGGVVLAGKIKGGIIEGGVIEGGEIGDGVIIKGGIINGTVTAGGSENTKLKKHSKTEMSGTGIQRNTPTSLPTNVELALKQSTHLEEQISKPSSEHLNDSRSGSPVSTQYVLQSPVTVSNTKDEIHNVEAGKSLVNEKSLNKYLGTLGGFLSSVETPSRVIQRKAKTHHTPLDGISFNIPSEDVSDLITKLKDGPKNLDELVSLFNHPEKVKHSEKAKYEHRKLDKSVLQKINPTKPRSSVMRQENKEDLPERSNNDVENEAKHRAVGVEAEGENCKLLLYTYI